MSEALPISTSRELALVLMKAAGIGELRRVLSVELDLSDTIARLKVTVALPQGVSELMAQELHRFDVISQSPDDLKPRDGTDMGAPVSRAELVRALQENNAELLARFRRLLSNGGLL